MICGITGLIEYLVAPGSAQSALARACDGEGRRKKFNCEIRELKVGAGSVASFSLVAGCRAAALLLVSLQHLMPLNSR